MSQRTKITLKNWSVVIFIIFFGSEFSLAKNTVFYTKDDITKMLRENSYYNRENNPKGIGLEHDFEMIVGGKIVHDKATELYWQHPGSKIRVGPDETQAYINELNNAGYGGYSDWRLPALMEVMALMNPFWNEKGGHIDSIFVDKNFPQAIWVSERLDSHGSKPRLHVNLKFSWIGHYQTGYGNEKKSIRAVRSGSTDFGDFSFLTEKDVEELISRNGLFDYHKKRSGFSRIGHNFEKESDGSVIFDRGTELFWQRSGSQFGLNYEQAIDFVNSLNTINFGGYSDWRLPTLLEAMHLLGLNHGDYPNFSPKFDKHQQLIWTCDKPSFAEAWVVTNESGSSKEFVSRRVHVRAVRSERSVHNAKLLNELHKSWDQDDSTENLKWADYGKIIIENNYFDAAINPTGIGKTHKYEATPDSHIIKDITTGLFWEKAGSEMPLTFERIQDYVQQLNERKVGGISTWRLPTLEETMSLIDPKENSNGLHIDSIFNAKQQGIWTSDFYSSTEPWVSDLKFGFSTPGSVKTKGMSAFVRAVGQKRWWQELIDSWF